MTKNEERLSKLFKELVPDMGKAESLAGELVRAINRIGYAADNIQHNPDPRNQPTNDIWDFNDDEEDQDDSLMDEEEDDWDEEDYDEDEDY